jgi:5-oxoprolinase (ATP-hydrolysing) subunit C
VSVQGFAHVIEPARPGRMHEGVPHGGPLVTSAFARAGGGAPAIEIYGKLTLDVGGEKLTVSTDAAHRVAYVGAEGGLAPLGPLRRGDRLAMTGEPSVAKPVPSDAPITIVLGPDPAPPDIVRVLRESTFRVAPASNRVGVRLEGPSMRDPSSPADRPSSPMVKGAIELTPAGLVVLGPDHPTTGGYPVLGVLRAHAMDRFFAQPVGREVRFVSE